MTGPLPVGREGAVDLDGLVHLQFNDLGSDLAFCGAYIEAMVGRVPLATSPDEVDPLSCEECRSSLRTAFDLLAMAGDADRDVEARRLRGVAMSYMAAAWSIEAGS